MARITRIGSILALCLFVLLSTQAIWVLAQTGTPTTPPPAQEQVGQPLGFWATAAFVWVILLLAMVFVIAMGWLSRSRRY
jgi:hypothetical protein